MTTTLPTPPPSNTPKPQRILILGGGFAGFYTARHLDRIFRHHPNVEITLISRENYFLMTPLLFEAGSGVLEPRHAVNPIRPMLKKARFITATVDRIDLQNRTVFASHPPAHYQFPYTHLVLALGGVANLRLIPGSERALGFKTLRDAIYLRNHIIDLFEQADAEENIDRRRALLTFIMIGAGIMGVELIGELTEFIAALLRTYPRLTRELIRFELLEAGPIILPELDRDLADHAATVLSRRGVHIRTSTPVKLIQPHRIHLPDGSIIPSETILLGTGVAPNPLLAALPLTHNPRGQVIVDPTLRTTRPEVWALGDGAMIPGPDGKPYPPLAQHALRQAKTLAHNLAAIIKRPPGLPEPQLQPFIYHTLGTLVSLGHYDGVGRVLNLKLRGFPAWWVWRTYYLLQMPRWERRLRVILDWTVALLFRNDAVKLDLFGETHPNGNHQTPTPSPGLPSTHITPTPH